MIINKAAKDLELDIKLQDSFGAKAAGIMLDLAAHSIITEGNAAQYYPDYAEYSCAVTPQIRQMGNHLSGNAGTAYASLLA